MRTRTVLLVVAALALSACHSPPGVPMGPGADPAAIPREAIVDGSREEVIARVDAAARARGLTPLADVPLQYTGPMPRTSNWAFCRTLRLSDGTRTMRVRVNNAVTTLRATVDTIAAGQQRVLVDPVFVGRYRSPRADGMIERPCRSFGVLEMDLIAELSA